jgi:hypothetical protein
MKHAAGLTAALRCVAITASVCRVLGGAPAIAQEMEPRAYSPSPVGANFFVTSYSWSSGGVLTDPTLPIQDVQADVQGLSLAIGHSFNLFGREALATGAVPYVLADVSGQVFEDRASVERNGAGDLRLRLAVNLRGVPAMTPREFAASRRTTIVGASLSISAPTGQYFNTKLINIGTNRWSFKPEVGVSFPKNHWDFDGYVGAWFYTGNDSFFPGSASRTQDAVLSIQGHASYSFQPRLWVAVDGTWYHGGASRVDDAAPSAPLNNSRLGVTLSLPVGKRYSAKIAYGSGVVARTGTDFNTVAIAWQVLWLSPRWSGR